MRQRNTFFISVFMALGLLVPSVSSAAALTDAQSTSIIGVVQSSPGTLASAFVSLITAFSNITMAQATSLIGVIQAAPGTPASAFIGLLTSFTVDTPADPPPVAPPVTPHIPPVGSVYPSSAVGYDLSFNATYFPSDNFNFGIISVTKGKAFVHNPLAGAEYSWTRFGSAPPTIYMNLNAPYGSTVAGNIQSPKSCPPDALNTATSTLGLTLEPTACEGYNYGYNAAKDAYAYAKANGVTSSLWWLDIETANSWSSDTAVNDATIQGAIDYLNTQNIRVGIYSAISMWANIADSYVPTETLGGTPTTAPTWLPIGTATQVDVINMCSNGTSFITGSPIWLVQYEANSTAIDQNVAC